MLLAESLSLIY